MDPVREVDMPSAQLIDGMGSKGGISQVSLDASFGGQRVISGSA